MNYIEEDKVMAPADSQEQHVFPERPDLTTT